MTYILMAFAPSVGVATFAMGVLGGQIFISSFNIITHFDSWEGDIAKLAPCQECDKLHTLIYGFFFSKMCLF